MERHDGNALIIYTDGSCKHKPRRGDYAFLLLTEDEAGEELVHEYNPPGALGATNNEMELRRSEKRKSRLPSGLWNIGLTGRYLNRESTSTIKSLHNSR